MSILIKGIEMPTNCAECPIGSVLYGYKCLAKNKQFDRYAFNSMQDWCPLIEVPEPHGPLIDMDDFLQEWSELESYRTAMALCEVIEAEPPKEE